MKKVRAVGIQYAALPFRISRRRVEVLLITSRETHRWVIPKGWPMNGLKPQDAAAVEAAEEAGVEGDVESRPIGSYRYMKKLSDKQTIAAQVIVFPLRVLSQADSWKEQGQRDMRWFSCQRAAGLVAEPSLRRLIRDFGRARTPSVSSAVLGHRSVKWGLSLLRPRAARYQGNSEPS